MSDSRYVPVTLRTLARPPGLFGSPGCNECSGSPEPDRGDRDRRRPQSRRHRAERAAGPREGRRRLALVGADELAFGEYVATGVIRVTTDACTDRATGDPVPRGRRGVSGGARPPDVGVSGGERVLSALLRDARPPAGEGTAVRRRLERRARVDDRAPQLPDISATSGAAAVAFSGTPVANATARLRGR